MHFKLIYVCFFIIFCRIQLSAKHFCVKICIMPWFLQVVIPLSFFRRVAQHQDGMCITPNALVKERSQNKQLSMFTRSTNLFLLAKLSGEEDRPMLFLPQVALLLMQMHKGFTGAVGRFIIDYHILKHLESQNGHLEFHPSESIPASLWTQFLSFGRVIFWQLLSQQNARRRCQNKWLLTLAPVFCIFWSSFQFSTWQSISSMGIFFSRDVSSKHFATYLAAEWVSKLRWTWLSFLSYHPPTPEKKIYEMVGLMI